MLFDNIGQKSPLSDKRGHIYIISYDMCAHLIKEAINVCVDRSDWVLKNNIIEKYFQGMNSYIF